MWQYRLHHAETRISFAYGALNLLYLLAALVGVFYWPRFATAMVAYVVLRSLLLLTLEAPETRYTLECFPIVIAFAALAIDRLWLMRQRCPGPLGKGDDVVYRRRVEGLFEAAGPIDFYPVDFRCGSQPEMESQVAAGEIAQPLRTSCAHFLSPANTMTLAPIPSRLERVPTMPMPIQWFLLAASLTSSKGLAPELLITTDMRP